MFGAGRLLPAAFVVVLATAGPVHAGDGTFSTQPTGSPYGAGSGARGVAIGDFDSDGNEDLVVANEAANSVTVRLGAGDGTFTAQAPGSPFTVANPGSVAVGDFNSDGDEDLAVTNGTSATVTVRLGAGNGSFPTEPTGSPFATGTTPRSVAVGDFDSDGNDDLAVSNSGSSSVTVRLGAGDGTFSMEPSGSPYATAGTPVSVAVGDFDSDGDEDLATANFIPNNITVRLGAGDGTFATEPSGSPYAAGIRPQNVAIGEFNSDGNEDLAVANEISNDITVRLGAGDGTFATEPAGSPFAAGTGPRSIGIGDFNSDGNEDFAAANTASDNLTVRLGAGDGTFATEPAGSPFGAGDGPIPLAVGDFDSDGNEDLTTANFVAGSATVRLGGGQPPLQGNLLENGGIEGSGAARTSVQFPSLPGAWERTGRMTYLRYGVAGGYPRHIASPHFLTGGLNLFWGGPAAANSQATQSVPVAGDAASIDAGLASATLAASLGGLRTENDRMSATATFQDAGGGALGTLAIGPVTPADRDNRTVLLRRQAVGPIPAGTRTIEVSLDATHATGPRNDALADNLKLTVNAPTPPSPPPPGPGTGTDPGAGGGTDEPPANPSGPAPPTKSKRPLVEGRARQGRQLTCTPGIWTGGPSFAYAWLRNGHRIGTVDDPTYVVRRRDVGRTVQCQVTATNEGGSTISLSRPRVAKPE